MSYYEVFISNYANPNPISIFVPDKKELVLVNAVVSLDAQAAGSFEFTMPRQHIFYDNIIPFGSNIEVKENNKTIFFGRPLPPSVDFWGNKTYHCEGALSFLNDVYLPPIDNAFEEIEFNALLDMVLGQYNRIQTRIDRMMSYDTSGFPSTMIYDAEQWNYQTVADYIRNYMHQFVGGLFYTEWDGDVIWFKWRSKLTQVSNQPVTFGVNLLDMMRTGKTFYTAAIAKGGQNLDGEVAQMLAPKTMISAWTDNYGAMTAYLEYPDATTVDALEAYCETYLNDQQFNGIVLEVNAADQHLRNTAYNEFAIGQLVHVTSEYQGVDATLPITKLEVDINSALKKATIGELDKVPFTISTKKAKAAMEKKAKEDAKKEAEKVKGDADSPTVIRGSDGNDYEVTVDVDPATGETTVIAKKVITSSIRFTESLGWYFVGDNFDLSKYEVTATYSDGTSRVVTDECAFNIQNGAVFSSSANLTLLATWTDERGKTKTAAVGIRIIQTHGKKIKIKAHELYEGVFQTGYGGAILHGHMDYTYIIESVDDSQIYLKRRYVQEIDEVNLNDSYHYMQIVPDSSKSNPSVKQTLIYEWEFEEENSIPGTSWDAGKWSSNGVKTATYNQAEVIHVENGKEYNYMFVPMPNFSRTIPLSLESYPLGGFGWGRHNWFKGGADKSYYAFYSVDGIEFEE